MSAHGTKTTWKTPGTYFAVGVWVSGAVSLFYGYSHLALATTLFITAIVLFALTCRPVARRVRHAAEHAMVKHHTDVYVGHGPWLISWCPACAEMQIEVQLDPGLAPPHRK